MRPFASTMRATSSRSCSKTFAWLSPRLTVSSITPAMSATSLPSPEARPAIWRTSVSVRSDRSVCG